ncbi:MAG TPA: DsrE family protein [Geothrix sp.]|jgi:intracellular sulfur oxidation DsrE/DsrF family protein
MAKRLLALPCLLLCLVSTAQPLVSAQAAPKDTAALKGLRVGKGIFDINLAAPEKLPLYLGVIKETFAGMKAQGVKPDLIVVFRGPAVKLVSCERDAFSPEQKASLERSDALIQELAGLGVRFEACAVATRIFQVDQEDLLPQVKAVGNTFVSLIGYQAKGYGMIPIQ